jgi:2-iminobutanoate/2-iminopropanoate deaminase
MEHFEKIHKVRLDYFKPALTMVEVCKMTSPEYLIRIKVIATARRSKR